MCAWTVIEPRKLAELELFKSFTESELHEISKLVSVEVHPRNELIVAEGTRGDRVFFIIEGAVRVSRTIPGIGEEALAILPAGSYFGEMSLFGDETRSADVFADKRTRLLNIYIDELKVLLEREPSMASKFLWACSQTLADRVRQSNAKVTFLSAAGKFEDRH